MTTRRGLATMLIGLAAILPTLAGAPAQAQDKATLRLNWYLGGLHVPFYYGVERGFYRDEGIDLTINEGRGSANTVQVVASGGAPLGRGLPVPSADSQVMAPAQTGQPQRGGLDEA